MCLSRDQDKDVVDYCSIASDPRCGVTSSTSYGSLPFQLELFGYFVPYFTLSSYFKLTVKSVDSALPITTMSLTSGIGRIICGILADRPGINRIFLQQIAFVSIGFLTLGLIAASDVYSLMFICVGLGLFDGCFITVLGPIAFDLVGKEAASQAVGFLLALCSVPLTIGPMVSGYIIDATTDYKYAYMYAGIPPLIGAVLMLPILRGISRCRGVGNATSSVSGSVPARGSFSSSEGGDGDSFVNVKKLLPSTQTSVTEIPGTPTVETNQVCLIFKQQTGESGIQGSHPRKDIFIFSSSSESGSGSQCSRDKDVEDVFDRHPCHETNTNITNNL